MSSNKVHDELIRQIILELGSSGLARVWRNDVGLYRTYQSGNVVQIGVPGVPDIIGFTSTGKFLGIEVKTGTGKLRDSQKNFRRILESCGGIFIEGRDLVEVRNALARELGRS